LTFYLQAFVGGFFQAAQAAKRRAWGGNPNKIPIGQNERLAKFGTMVESCSKKVAASSVWASVNTFSAASGDFAKTAAVFPPTTYNTTQSKNDGDLRKFLPIPYKTT